MPPLLFPEWKNPLETTLVTHPSPQLPRALCSQCLVVKKKKSPRKLFFKELLNLSQAVAETH